MIVNRQRNVRFARKPLETFLVRAQKELGVQGFGVTVCFVSDDEIAGMNERFRGKAGPTDVLSFPAANKQRVLAGGRKETYTETAKKGQKKTKPAETYLGDIAIAPETARRYAKKSRRSLNDELRVLILHGVLHLMGYDHETDQGEMNRIERKMRRRFGLA
ncbi:MAG: rRNA maturation RNase YbeY [Candidatus Acidiferrum sp.]